MTAPESHDGTLMRAVTRMRADADRCGDGLASFIPAAADLLESFTTCGCDENGDHWAEKSRALKAARAYLGEQEERGTS